MPILRSSSTTGKRFRSSSFRHGGSGHTTPWWRRSWTGRSGFTGASWRTWTSQPTPAEKQPGGLLDQFQTALIERLDIEEYYNLVGQCYERRLQEAFNPYWRRHCKRLDSGWIYNRIFKKFWWPKTEKYPDSGCWINNDYSGKDYRFPPQLKEETQ